MKSQLGQKNRATLCVAVIIILYTVLSFYRLGNTYAPSTGWESEEKGREIFLDLGEEKEINSLIYYLGKYENRRLLFSVGSGEPVTWEKLPELSMPWVYQWGIVSINRKVRYLKFVTENQFTDIREFILTDSEGRTIEPENRDQYTELFDEAWMYPGRISFQTGTVFDETVFARTAYEYLHGIRSYEDTHPPMGKLMISLGIAVFGMNPFGWRAAGVTAGVLLLFLLWRFAERIFKDSWISVGVLALLAFDFLHFTESRLGQIDSFLVLFMTAMFYFLFRYYETLKITGTGKSDAAITPGGISKETGAETGETAEIVSGTEPAQNGTVAKTGWKYLILSGIFMGLAVSCKWSGFYGVAGLFLILLCLLVQGLRTGRMTRSYALKTCGICMLSYILIPAAIYVASYIPYVSMDKSLGFWERVIVNQLAMFFYHTGVGSVHPSASEWYQWPVSAVPVRMFTARFSNMVETVSLMGNPAFWWPGATAFFLCLYRGLEKKEGTLWFLLIGYLAPLLPWIFISRYSFLYHYYPCLPFLALLMGYTAERGGKYGRICLGACVVLSGILFVMFYPVISGLPVNAGYVTGFLEWLPTWEFVS